LINYAHLTSNNISTLMASFEKREKLQLRPAKIR
jgi:hypothetical protein